MAVLEPDVVTAIVPVSSPHPRRVRSASMQPWRRRISLGYAAGFQVPFLPERALTRDEGSLSQGTADEVALFAAQDVLPVVPSEVET